MKLIRKHSELYDLNLGPLHRVVGQAKHCTGCLVATSPGECYFADVAGPIRLVGIGGAKYILVAVDEYTRFLHVMPMRR